MLHSLFFRTTHATLFDCCPSLMFPGTAFIGLKDLGDFFYYYYSATHMHVIPITQQAKVA